MNVGPYGAVFNPTIEAQRLQQEQLQHMQSFMQRALSPPTSTHGSDLLLLEEK